MSGENINFEFDENSNCDVSDNENYWTTNRIQLMINTRMEFEEKFQESKKDHKILWTRILHEIKKVDKSFPFSKAQIITKFTNLFTTYKRIIKRNEKTGRGKTLWIFFENFDRVYGNKHVITAPPEILFDTFDENYTNDNNNSVEKNMYENEDLNASRKRKKYDNINDNNNSVEKNLDEYEDLITSQKRKKYDLLNYLKDLQEKEQQRHEEFMALEKEKLKLELERTKVLINMQLLLSDLFLSDF